MGGALGVLIATSERASPGLLALRTIVILSRLPVREAGTGPWS